MIVNERIPTDLKTSDFQYDLPEELIAQHPADPRDSARLMVLNRKAGTLEHRIFRDVLSYIRPGDVLVVNDSRVIPARLYGTVADRPEANMEMLLLRERDRYVWEVLVKPGKRARVGMELVFGDGLLRAVVEDIVEEGNRMVRFSFDETRFGSLYEVFDKVGMMPLPPYITEKLKNNDDYQTVYARENGSAAAPTAGLHFTTELLEQVKAKGAEVVSVLLHVGLGTFRPVKEERIEDHLMHTEWISVSKEAADRINARRAAGGRIICVGTTSCRTLESVADEQGRIVPYSGETGIFIYPGYRFRAVDALITNFHLPQSTLLMLVSAFAGKDFVMDAYRCAVREKYRFFSFGDAMLIC